MADILPTTSSAQTLIAEKAQPSDVIQQQATNQDYIVLRVAVYGLIIIALLAGAGVVFLSFANKDIPEGILALGSTSVGALATMLVRPPSSNK